jgi:hypothetical protein
MNKKSFRFVILGVGVLTLALLGIFFWVRYPEFVKIQFLVLKMFWDIFVKFITHDTFFFVIFILFVVFMILTKIYKHLPDRKQ